MDILIIIGLFLIHPLLGFAAVALILFWAIRGALKDL